MSNPTLRAWLVQFIIAVLNTWDAEFKKQSIHVKASEAAWLLDNMHWPERDHFGLEVEE